ncbi:MAG: hypothetical protein IT435_04850 [Phycisphaerales bacterium]|nr:hypothetical protein [Phycisphaerales bacterium]
MARSPVLIGWLAAGIILALVGHWTWSQYHRWGDWQVATLRTFPILVLGMIGAAGCICIGCGWPMRQGTEPRCAACGHEYTEDQSILLNHCQECGAPWRWFDGRTTGLRAGRPGLVWIGVGLLALPISARIADSLDQTLLRPVKPRWAMLKTVQSALLTDALDDWKELLRQSYNDPGLRNELASAIMDRRTRGLPLAPEFTDGVHFWVLKNQISTPMVDRWFGEMFQLRVEMPTIMRAGERVKLTATGRFMDGWAGVADVPQVCIGGVLFGDDYTPQLRSENLLPAQDMFTWRTLANGSVTAPDKPGQVKATFSAWLVIGMPASHIRYAIDGAVIPPDGAIVREFRWTRTVDVVEASAPASPVSGDEPAPPAAP